MGMSGLSIVVVASLGLAGPSSDGAVEADASAVRAEALRFVVVYLTGVKSRPWPPDPHQPVCLGQGKGTRAFTSIADPAPEVLDALPQTGRALVAWSSCPVVTGRVVVGDLKWRGADRADVTVADGTETDLSRGFDLSVVRTRDGWRVDETAFTMWAVVAD
jgi:hypothetical protein